MSGSDRTDATMKNILKIIISAIIFLAMPFMADAYMSKGKAIRVLAIGNSFSCDAVEEHLYELSKAAGNEITIGNAFIGGCTLATHYNCATTNKASYQYSKRRADGTKSIKSGVSLESILLDEDWDIITFQQQSGLSGIYDSWKCHLPLLLSYVKSIVSYPTTFMIHQTWAYDESSTHGDFERYSHSQETMYRSIVRSVSSISRLTGISRIIPSGTAIQNARTTPLKDSITRDGYHLSLNVGRYIAACTWFESLFHKCVVGNPYCPKGMDTKNKFYAQRAAHAAVSCPVKTIKIR